MKYNVQSVRSESRGTYKYARSPQASRTHYTLCIILCTSYFTPRSTQASPMANDSPRAAATPPHGLYFHTFTFHFPPSALILYLTTTACCRSTSAGQRAHAYHTTRYSNTLYFITVPRAAAAPRPGSKYKV